MTTSSDRIGSQEPAASSKTQTDCKSTTPTTASFETNQTPWAESSRAEAKTRLAQYVAEKPEGVPLPIVVTDVFNVESVDAEMADYQLTRRFFIRRDEFRIDRREDFLWVEPTPTLFTCFANKHSPKPPDAKRNAQRALRQRQTIDNDTTRGYLLGALAAKRDATEDRFVAFEDRETPENHLLVPYATRFNSPSRVHEARERFDDVWTAAGENYRVGVVLTLTTHPIRFDSIADATDTLMDDVNRLKSWHAQRFRDGSRAASLVVPEFTKRGVPHVHVVLFGETYIPHSLLSRYWGSTRNRGDVVWSDRIVHRDRGWRWDGQQREGRTPRMYISKHLQSLASLAASDPTDVHASAQALRNGVTGEVTTQGQEWWKLACYWATDMRLFTVSPSLRPNDTDNTVSNKNGSSRWRFIGVAQYGNFPAYITNGATLIRRERRRRPPP